MIPIVTKLFAGKNIVKYVLYAGVAAGVFFTVRYYWRHPEILNKTAKGYLVHVGKLSADSTRWHRDSLGYEKTIAGKDSVIKVRDSTIVLLTAEYNKAIKYGDDWRNNYNQQVAVTDATASLLSDREKLLATYRMYEKNGTLRTNIPNLSPASSEAITAAFQTASREDIGRKTLDSLGKSIGTYKAETQRLGRGLKTATARVGTLADSLLMASTTGGFPILRGPRRRAQRKAAVQLKGIQNQTEKVLQLRPESEESELEQIENRVKQ